MAAKVGVSWRGQGDPSVHLRSRLCALGLKGVLEKSLKIDGSGLRSQRYVVGVAASSIAEWQLTDLLAYCKTPYAVAVSALERRREASTIGVGQDGDWEGGSRRLYLEYWQRLAAENIANRADLSDVGNVPLLSVGAKRLPGVHVMDAWKWQPSRMGEWYESRYYVFPGLNREESFAVFADHTQTTLTLGSGTAGLRSLLAELSGNQDSSCCAQLWSAWDLDQESNLLARQTLDLNILDFEMPAQRLHGITPEICAAFPTAAAQWHHWLERLSATKAIVSHLAAGIDRQGSAYFCLYYLDGAY